MFLECPACHRKLNVPQESAGHWVECQACGMGFAAFEQGGPAEEPGEIQVEPRQLPVKTLVVAGGGALVLTLACVISAMSGRPSGVLGVPASERWTHRELITYLHESGLEFESTPSDSDSLYGPAMLFYRHNIGLKPNQSPVNPLGALQVFGLTSTNAVYVQKRASVAEARDHAGVTRHGFSWGRFYFNGDEKFLAEIRRALGVPD